MKPTSLQVGSNSAAIFSTSTVVASITAAAAAAATVASTPTSWSLLSRHYGRKEPLQGGEGEVSRVHLRGGPTGGCLQDALAKEVVYCLVFILGWTGGGSGWG